MSYIDYLQTEAWAVRRQMAIDAAGGRCQLCNTDGLPLEVHHRTYERLGFEHPMDLTVLCEKCHRKHHDADEPNKAPEIDLHEAQSRLLDRRRALGVPEDGGVISTEQALDRLDTICAKDLIIDELREQLRLSQQCNRQLEELVKHKVGHAIDPEIPVEPGKAEI